MKAVTDIFPRNKEEIISFYLLCIVSGYLIKRTKSHEQGSAICKSGRVIKSTLDIMCGRKVAELFITLTVHSAALFMATNVNCQSCRRTLLLPHRFSVSNFCSSSMCLSDKFSHHYLHKTSMLQALQSHFYSYVLYISCCVAITSHILKLMVSA